MDSLIGVVGVAVVLFVSTNLDDLFLLIGFFADSRVRLWQVMSGQFLGIAALYAISVTASMVSLVLPEVYLGLLGLVPVAMGIAQLGTSWTSATQDDDETFAPRRGTVAAVAAVTVAAGGDNIAVYTPVFAVQSAAETAVTGLVFAVLVLISVGGAGWLTSRPAIGELVLRYGRRLAPFVLIAIGVLVFLEAGTHRLLG